MLGYFGEFVILLKCKEKTKTKCIMLLKGWPCYIHVSVTELLGILNHHDTTETKIKSCILNRFSLFGPHWINISLVETRNYSILSLGFIASSFRVTEENLVFETIQSGPYSTF